MIDSKYIIKMDVVNTLKTDIKDMNVMELTEEITETTKIAALNLWGTNRERTNIAIDECAQKMKDIRLKANKDKLDDAVGNIVVAFRSLDVLMGINDIGVANISVQDITKIMLDNDDESLTSVSDCDSDSDS